MSIPAYIYARFSSLEQGKGTSLKRQIADCRDRIEREGWEYPATEQERAERDYTDEGKSAYFGAHRSPGGSLFEFERKAAEGHFANGAVLIVENLDRLTRQGWEEALKILTGLTSNGVTVATLHGNKLWKAGEKPDMGQVITVIVEAEADHRASHEKSKRVKAAWDRKVTAIVAGERKAFTKVLPAWLEVCPTSGVCIANRHRAAIVQEIYQKYVDGYGLPAIVRSLNERGEPSWGYGIKRGDGWNTAYLHKLLTNRAVMGEFAPNSRSRHTPTHLASSRGVIVPDYYPQVISADLFNRAQAARKSRVGMGGRANTQQANLFAGLARCSECGAKMYFQSQQKAGRRIKHTKKDGSKGEHVCRTDRSYLQCNNNRRGLACPNNGKVRYEYLEQNILDALLTNALDSRSFAAPDRVATIRNAIAEHERGIENKRLQLRNVVDSLAVRFSAAVANKAADLEEEISEAEELVSELRTSLRREMGEATPNEHLERVLQVRNSLDHADPKLRYAARLKVHHALRGLIDAMECTPDGTTMIVAAKGSIGFTFDAKGRCTDMSAQNAVYRGPDGEPDWHPDEEAA
jgi:DNA invertase Pin-like site-specific DNA recombinase